MTLRHLRIFLAVCDNGCNMTKAAEALHMTQPAASLAIKELEGYYGVVLFDRLGRRLRLSGAGERGLVTVVRVNGLDFTRRFRIAYHRDKYLTPLAAEFMALVRSCELDYPDPQYTGLY